MRFICWAVVALWFAIPAHALNGTTSPLVAPDRVGGVYRLVDNPSGLWVWHVRGGTVAAFLDISNLYMNQSVVQYQYNYDYRERGAIKALPIIPSIGLRGDL